MTNVAQGLRYHPARTRANRTRPRVYKHQPAPRAGLPPPQAGEDGSTPVASILPIRYDRKPTDQHPESTETPQRRFLALQPRGGYLPIRQNPIVDPAQSEEVLEAFPGRRYDPVTIWGQPTGIHQPISGCRDPCRDPDPPMDRPPLSKIPRIRVPSSTISPQPIPTYRHNPVHPKITSPVTFFCEEGLTYWELPPGRFSKK